MGLASVCHNFDFARDSGGPTQATTRAGINRAMQCLDPDAPVTGLLGFTYEPESATDPFFQLPIAFQPTVGSQYEHPVGSGTMQPFPHGNFDEPEDAHAIQVSAGNQVFTAYSDLVKPLSPMSTMDPKYKALNPFGMKPFGWNWAPDTQVLQGEVCTPAFPATGNGHTYQAQNSGTTSRREPTWPLTDAGTVNDGNIVWKEHTMVIANRLPPPAAPALALISGGAFGSGLDVYVVMSLLNTAGETLPSAPEFITTVLVGGSSVNVQVPTLVSLMQWMQNLPAAYVPTHAKVYVAFATHGDPAPALSTFAQFGAAVVLGTLVTVTTGGSGSAPPTICSARVTPGQLPTPVVEPQIQRSPANALVQPPALPALTEVPTLGSSLGGGYYVGLTLLNSAGETTIGGLAYIIIAAGSGIKVYISSNYGPTVTGVNVWFVQAGGGAPTYLANASPEALGSSPTFTALGPNTPLPANNTAALPVGSFPLGRDVYVAATYTNALGETPLGPPNSIINTNADDSVLVTITEPLGPDNEQLYVITSVGIYEADVPTGTAAPPASAFSLVGYYQPKDQPFILNSATGPNPPVTNTTGPGGSIVADTASGGANGTQGYRYAAMGWINQLETFSGFTQASVVSTIIDEDGWEIGAFNVPTGMANVVGRYIAFTIADGSQAGPFNWIGLVNLLAPAQNVVYPTQTFIDQVEQSATVFLDNVTTQGLFNFTDSYLVSENNVDDRLNIAIPPVGVRVDYLESLGRLAVTGVPGLASGAWISLGDDPESFYAADSQVPISSAGDQCFGVTDQYKGIVFALMKSGGFVLSPNTGQNPNSWSANRRWGGVKPEQQLGPCGFRAWAACGKFIIFAHRSGLYKYDTSDPDMMSKEIPKLWSTINWAAGATICVTIDEDTHTVRVLVPTGASMVPNKELSLSYIEGWNNPIHFSTFSGREISMDSARRWSVNDVSAFICARLERTLPAGGNAYIDGPTFNTLPDSSFQLTQLLYASSGPDGTIQARTPGIFEDNGGYIDYEYEPMSTGLMQAICKPEGFNLNACGSGILNASFIASRDQVTDQGGEQVLIQELDELPCEPIALSVRQVAGITRKVPPSVNEFWRVRFAGNKQPGDWVSLKAMTVYVIPFTSGRDAGDR